MSQIDKETCAASTLTVSLKPKAKPGPFRKKVTLYTNDTSAPVVEIPIVGEVLAPKSRFMETKLWLQSKDKRVGLFCISFTVYARL